MKTKIKKLLNNIFSNYGYKLEKIGLNYIDAKSTIKKAKEMGLSICDYREKTAAESTGLEIRLGRTKRIISRINDIVDLKSCPNICEIGTGTGIYLEKVLDAGFVEKYENYETDIGWKKYLKNTYKNDARITVYEADGKSLSDTKDESCDLIHAHGVFVYLPVLVTLEYLKEAVRICKTNKYIVFDAFIDESFDYNSAKKWLNGIHRFPVIIPQKLLLDFANENKLELIGSFNETFGNTQSDYLIFRKNP